MDCRSLPEKNDFIDFENELKLFASPGTFRSRRLLLKYIFRKTEEYGFQSVIHNRSSSGQLYLRIRVKYFLKYGNPPVSKALVIPKGFVKNLLRINKAWPELGEYLLNAALLHELHHMNHELTSPEDLDLREHMANRFMIEEMGIFSLVVCLWYLATHRDNGTLNRILPTKRRIDHDNAEKEIISCLNHTYPDIVLPQGNNEIVDAVIALEKQFNSRTGTHCIDLETNKKDK